MLFHSVFFLLAPFSRAMSLFCAVKKDVVGFPFLSLFLSFLYIRVRMNLKTIKQRATSTRLNDGKWVFEYYFLFQDLNQSNGPDSIKHSLLLLFIVGAVAAVAVAIASYWWWYSKPFENLYLYFTLPIFYPGCFIVYNGIHHVQSIQNIYTDTGFRIFIYLRTDTNNTNRIIVKTQLTNGISIRFFRSIF